MLSRLVRESSLPSLPAIPHFERRRFSPAGQAPPVISTSGELHFTVSPEIDRLLAIGARPLEYFPGDISTTTTTSTTPAVSTAASEDYNFNIPVPDRMYVHMSVEDMLMEYTKVALDVGAPEEAVLARDRLMGNMLFALRLTPARQHDMQRLRQAYYPMEMFFFRFGPVMKTALAYSPELKPALMAVSAQWAREAIPSALAVPLGPNGEAHYEFAEFRGVLDTIPTPRELTKGAEEWLHEQSLAAARKEARWFFGEQVSLCLRDVFSTRETDLIRFTQGHIVIQPAKIALLTVVRTVPAGQMQPFLDDEGRPQASMHAEYPDTGWRQSLKAIWLELPSGQRVAVDVAMHEGKHSFTLNAGMTWHETGAAHSLALEALRADSWRTFLGQKLAELERIRRGPAPVDRRFRPLLSSV